jgi:CBS domain-containing protein
LSDIPVAAVMARAVRSCKADDPLATVLQTMAEAQVHRLPVVDARGALVGIVSTNDLVRAANGRPAAVDVAGVIKALAAISAPRRKAAAAPAPAAPIALPIAPGPITTGPAAATVVVPQPNQPSVRPVPRKPKGKKG